ncbi:shikimate kinase [Yoonia sp. MH D7]
MTQAEVKPILHRTVVLVGMMGSGKTAVGRALATELEVPFLDSDVAIEEAATQSIPEIFERDGEAFFRKREAEVIDRLLSGPPVILSTGGGAFLSDRTRALIAKKAVSLWLNVDLKILWERVRNKNTRPLLMTHDPLGTLTRLLAERTPIYAKAKLEVVIKPNASIESTTADVLDALAADPQILERTP